MWRASSKVGCNGKAGSQWRGLMALCEDVGQAQELVGDCVFYLCFLFVSVEKFLGVGVVEAILHSGGKEIRPHSLLSRSTMGRDRIWADETCCLGSEGLTKKKKKKQIFTSFGVKPSRRTAQRENGWLVVEIISDPSAPERKGRILENETRKNA